MASPEELKKLAEAQEAERKRREETAAAAAAYESSGGMGGVVGSGAASESGGGIPVVQAPKAPAKPGPGGDVPGYDYSSPDAIIDFLKESQDKQDRRLDELISAGTADYRQNAELADTDVAQILADLKGADAGFQDAELPGFAGGYESQGANAYADNMAIGAQYGTLAKLQELSDPSVTAKEQFMMEQSRMAQEGDQRAYRDAIINNLSQRGALGSGGEIAALLGSQQETGQRRMLEDLGTRAGAVDRSMRALESSGQLAGDIRGSSFEESFKRGTAADDAAAFNADLKSQYDQWTTKLKQDQAKDAWGRDIDIASTGAAAVQDRFNRGVADTNFEGNIVTGSQIPGQQQTTSAVVDTLNKSRAERLAKEAADALKPEERGWGQKLLDPLDIFGD